MNSTAPPEADTRKRFYVGAVVNAEFIENVRVLAFKRKTTNSKLLRALLIEAMRAEQIITE